MMQRPNILWIVTSQWRAQALGYAGDPNAHTPRLDALAAQATNYLEAVTPHPFSPFARAALLTGRPSPENGVAEYFDPLPVASAGAPGPAGGAGRTIAHRLNERGYVTSFFGKWHLSARDPRAALVGEVHARSLVPPTARGGFQFWEGFESGFLLNDPWLHGTRLPEPQKFSGYQSDVLGERVARWLGQRTREAVPWFCVVSLEPPHPPYDAPASGVRTREPAEIALNGNVPRGGAVERQARAELAGYYAHIEATDRAIGRLVQAVDAAARQRGQLPPIVVFTSVHGDMHGAHGLFRKGWPHEESVRVPLLVRIPASAVGAESAGTRSDLVSLIDLPRWTEAWADAPAAHPPRPQGGEMQRISMPSVVAVPHQCDRAWRGVRTRERKLVLNADGSPWLLFDLQQDPGELRNLAHDPACQPEIARLRAWI